MLETISNFFSWLYNTITGFFGWLLSLFTNLISAFLSMLKDLSVWLFDTLLGLGVAALNLVSVPTQFLDYAGYWAALPADLINLLGVLGIHTAFSIILMAYGVRLILRLIPYVGGLFK
jgi:hypothetical protein